MITGAQELAENLCTAIDNVFTPGQCLAGGNAFFTICLWRSGYALTDPGFSVFNPEARLFDPFQYEVCLCIVQAF